MNILIVAAHPDDEILGAGASAARWSAQGHDVKMAILGEGVTSRFDSRAAGKSEGVSELSHLETAIQEAARCVNASAPTLCMGLPDNRFDSLDLLDVVKPIESLIEETAAERVVTHHPGDLNVDHQITAQAVLTATRPQPGQLTKELWAFEIPSSTEWAFGGVPFLPQIFVDVSEFIESKLKALRAYESEMRDPPHARSYCNVENLARVRGATVGTTAAEAFHLLRCIQ